MHCCPPTECASEAFESEQLHFYRQKACTLCSSYLEVYADVTTCTSYSCGLLFLIECTDLPAVIASSIASMYKKKQRSSELREKLEMITNNTEVFQLYCRQTVTVSICHRLHNTQRTRSAAAVNK